MAALLLALMCLGYGVSVVSSNRVMQCLVCQEVNHPSDCTFTVNCPVDQICATTASQKQDGTIVYQLLCLDHNTCQANFSILSATSIIGKRMMMPVHNGPNHAQAPDTHNHPSTDTLVQTTADTLVQTTAATNGVTTTDTHELTRGSIGRAARENEVCLHCCSDADHCNERLCLKPAPAPTTAPPPTTPTTSATKPSSTITLSSHSTVNPGNPDPNCRDREEDGIPCPVLNMTGLCLGKTLFSHVMARKKCPKFCGFCTAPANAPQPAGTPPPPALCDDFEQDGLKCIYFDMFDFCNDDSNGFSYVIKHEKCKKHCGVCTPNITTTTTTPAPTPTCPTIPTTPSTTPSTTTTPPTVTASKTTQVPIVTASATVPTCYNLEDANFNCTDWASHGYCLPFPGIGYETSKLRCRKYCGYCQ